MRAILTWRAPDGIRVEEVELVPPDHPIYLPVEGGIVELPYTTDDLMDSGKVFFEDENGLFGLNPRQILSVEVIGRNIYDSYNENNSTKENVMNLIKKSARSTKNFVYKHRVGVAVVTTALAVGTLQRSNIKLWNQFLEDKGLTDEFYNNY